MSKYDPLTAFLRNRPLEDEKLVLSLDEIERVLGTATCGRLGNSHGQEIQFARWKPFQEEGPPNARGVLFRR